MINRFVNNPVNNKKKSTKHQNVGRRHRSSRVHVELCDGVVAPWCEVRLQTPPNRLSSCDVTGQVISGLISCCVMLVVTV